MSADRDIDGKLKQKFGKIEAQVGDWKPNPGPGCLLPVLVLIISILRGKGDG